MQNKIRRKKTTLAQVVIPENKTAMTLLAYPLRPPCTKVSLLTTGSLLLTTSQMCVLTKSDKMLSDTSSIVSQFHIVQHKELQMAPDRLYDYNRNRFVSSFPRKSEQERLAEATSLSSSYVYGWNRNQRSKGAIYTGKSIVNKSARHDGPYVVTTNCDLILTNLMDYTSRCPDINVRVRYLNGQHNIVKEFHENARSLASTWERETSRTCTRKSVRGRMKTFGTLGGSGALREWGRQSTRHNTGGSNLYHRRLNTAAKTIVQELFPHCYTDISDTMRFLRRSIPEEIGGDHGLCCELIQSQDSLTSESHVDEDVSKCVAIWTAGNPSMANDTDGFFFVLPYVKYGGHKGVAIKGRHGVAIEWDGRTLFHCSTSPNDRRVNMLGTFFGITAI